jgi:putative membrane protein
VRSFARKLAQDHARAEKELSQLFSRKGIPPEPELAGNLQNSLDRLAGLKGGQFDQAFKQQVIEDHQKAIALFEKQAEQGTDPELKAFAQKHLPHLREHIDIARGLPVSSDTEGPPPENSVNTILQNPATRGINGPR